jgi:photosystem II stability/assembly factor-like uncharacterized protein
MNSSIRLPRLILVSTATILSLLCAQQVLSRQPSPGLFSELHWRLIGPFRGGRVLAISGVPGKPNEYVFGAVDGGVWKTANAGQTWQPIFDSQPIASIGAIAIAPSQPQTIYVGSGEADMRSDISFGDGIYRSTDGGWSWRNIGLRDSQQIGRILVHPRNANIVLVAALGHAFGPNAERGVYRSVDGGTTWKKVLGKNDDTGAIDLCFDPGNPQIVYASLWQTRRPPWSVYAPTSGPGSGLYKSVDGGITWHQISGNGFPNEGVGRIGIAVAPGGNGRRVFAIVDAAAGGLYRSDDSANTWRRVSSDHRIWKRGWYFGGITADPREPNTVYVSNTSLYRSIDGGENFEAIKGAPGGDDYHSLWIAPDDPERMILGSDQGAAVSVDRGKSWSSWYNQPTAQFYHVTVDNRFPYMVYGSQQDSGTAGVFSRSDYGQITSHDWSPVGGEESGYIALSPADPSLVYGGGPLGTIFRFDWTTGQSINVAPETQVSAGNRLRFTWTSPLVVSPQNPAVLYFGAQYVLRTEDRGQHWQTISPDLTFGTHPANSTDSQDEHKGVVYTIAPSSIRAGEIWAGTDNGFIRLTTDEGKTWDDATPAGMPDWSMISLIEASHFDAASAYAAVDRHQVDDFHPYIYRTHDAGKTWRNIVTGVPANAYVHVVREDLERRGLLYAGTELGIFFSLDDGEHWQPLQMNLPVTSIRDIALHGDDLIVATHGRSFWILDDLEPLREWAEHVEIQDTYLYHPAHALRIRNSENHDSPLPVETPVGENPPAGAIIDYNLKSAVAGDLVLEIHDVDGRLVRRISSADKSLPITEPPEFPSYWLHPPRMLSNAPGFHRFVWDLRYAQLPALRFEFSSAAPISTGTFAVPQGPLVLPGEYEVRLITPRETLTQRLTVDQDPRVHVSRDDIVKQFELEQQIDASIASNTRAYREIQDLRAQLSDLSGHVFGNSRANEIRGAADVLDHLAEQIAGRDAEYPLLPTGLIELDRSLSSLAVAVGTADTAPTAQSAAAYNAAHKRLSDLLANWDALKKEQLAQLNTQLQKAGLRGIVLVALPRPSTN